MVRRQVVRFANNFHQLILDDHYIVLLTNLIINDFLTSELSTDYHF